VTPVSEQLILLGHLDIHGVSLCLRLRSISWLRLFFRSEEQLDGRLEPRWRRFDHDTSSAGTTTAPTQPG